MCFLQANISRAVSIVLRESAGTTNCLVPLLGIDHSASVDNYTTCVAGFCTGFRYSVLVESCLRGRINDTSQPAGKQEAGRNTFVCELVTESKVGFR